MKKKWLALLMGTSLALAACGGNDDNADNEPASDQNETTTVDAGDAAKIYENKCSSCHAVNLEGGVGPNLTKVGSRLSKDEIEQVIAKGQGAMPKGIIQGTEASKVAEWLAEHK
ncbi:cytochrome c551 [Peribacillus butanolivorans]|jgi:cytochrome c551|uniref:Cytochrome c n=1 Tax=Peribacillus butanolivorans TaxID=421767 RepID=A0AAX0RR00_9BACI|nr:cytochrome c [Peribacillus butanolivorans]KRF65100.1 cytochrome C551 [Bacillus sp. Soil768D1]AXN38744.1 cytochrome c [Peribacillus butanolivorans]KON66971.1 cytochrome C551 [Peribacillus butanolivorans]MCO0595859.1 c-type cytochrome [Peribacillus butanolivorans]MED3689441.1 cytochrome c [Peribacillus butanolivorans]